MIRIVSRRDAKLVHFGSSEYRPGQHPGKEYQLNSSVLFRNPVHRLKLSYPHQFHLQLLPAGLRIVVFGLPAGQSKYHSRIEDNMSSEHL